MSFGEYFAGFSQLGRGIVDEMDRAEQKSALSKLGEQLQGGDYAGAAGTAFKAGDLQTGINLLKLGQGQAQSAQANAAFGGLAGLYGGGGGFGVGGPVGAPGGGPAPAGGVPSFLDSSGPSGNYLAGLFKRESGNNPNAQASTSGARGLGQFIPSTWNATARQHPELGLTPVGPGTDGRTNPQQMIAATKALTADNEGILAKSGLPVNDATRYALHFLGAGGGPRLIAGTLRNPDAPAASYADPKAVAANRNVFFNRDGTPKSAGQVMQDFGRSFAGGASGGGQAAPAAPVRTASADPDFMPSMPTLLNRPLAPAQGINPGRPQPPPSAGLPSMVGQPAPAEIGVESNILDAPMRTAGPPQTALPVPSRPPQTLIPQSMAGMGIPGTVMDRGAPVAQVPAAPGGGQRQAMPGSVADLPGGLSSPQPRGPNVPQRTASLPSDPSAAPTMPNAGPQFMPTLPGGQDAAPSRVMTLPGQDGDAPSPQARAQISAQAPQHLAQAGLPPAVAQAGAGGAPGSSQRIGVLMRIAGLPGLSEAQSGVVKSLLANELEQTKLPELQKNYMLARSQGFTGTLLDYQNELRKPLTPTIVAPGNAAIAPGERAPFYVNPRAPTAVSAGTTLFDTITGQPIYTAPAKEGADEGAKIAAQIEARRQAAPGLGLQENSPSWRSFVATGKVGADRDMSAADKKLIETADNSVLAASSTISALNEAKELSKKAYGGPWAGKLSTLGNMIGVGTEAAEATQNLDNLLTTNALGQLRSIFGGNPTEGERAILLEIQGSSTKPDAVRQTIYDRGIKLAQLRLQQNQDKADALREGRYFRQGGNPAQQQGAVASGQGGAPALPPPSPSNRPGAPTGSPPAVSAPPAAVDHLRQNPGLSAAFDAKYGPGSAAAVLGGR